MADKIPDITVSDADLNLAGFTISGKERYVKTVNEYSKVLFEKAVNFGEIDKAQSREVTHEHVKASAHSIANSFGRPAQAKGLWAIKAGQYLCAALIGVATNHLDKIYGAIGFVVAFSIGGILLYVETSKNK
jgi:hypothetical protein